MARYTERRLIEELSATGYEPTAAMEGDPDFGGYAILDWRQATTVSQTVGRSSRERAYVLGSALCTLLDRLGVEWKAAALDAGEPLEALVASAT
jgi:hypothetical protein